MLDRRFLSLVGNPRTLGLVAFLLSVPIGVPATLSVPRNPFASVATTGAWLAIGAAAQLALGAVLAIGNVALRHRDFSLARTRAAAALVAMGAGAARGVVLALLPGLYGLPTTTPIPVRIVSSAIIFGLWLVVIGAALGANDRYRSELSSLIGEIATHELQLRLVDDRESFAHRSNAAARVAEASEPISAALRPADTSQDYARTSQDYARTARLVQAAIEERIRPLSHELWFDRAPVIAAPRDPLGFARRVVSAPVPWRRAVPLMTALLLWNSLVGVGWPLGLFAGLAGSALVAAIVITCTSLGRARRLPSNVAMYLLLLLIPAPVELAIIEAVSGERLPTSFHILLAVGIPLAFLLGALASTVIDDRESTLRALRARIDDDVWDEHLGALHRRQVESDVGSFLHNTVQSRLVAASLQLQRAAAHDDHTIAEQALERAREALQMAAALSSPVGHEPARERLEYLAVAWQGLADVTIALPDVLEPEGAWLLAAQAIDECVANAVRHGHARRVHVRCRLGDSALEVEIDDDGSIPPSEGAPGLGSDWMDQATKGRWARAVSSDGTRLTLRIPLHRPSSG